MKRKNWLGWVVGLGVLLIGGVVGRADADYDQALRTAPQGISLDNIFVPGTTSNNQAAVVGTTNPAVTGTQAAKVNNGKKQFGAIWSTADNVFDLTKDQSASMWLYFGNTGKKAADGMAFVMHNDENGLAATPTFGKNVSGETLGVWGVDTDKKQTTPDKLATMAIQNSWALEFDTHLNTSTNYGNTGDADSFDVGIAGPHIANNYPAATSSYQMVRTSTLLPIYSVGYYATQTHEGLLQGDYTLLANGAWHHLSLDWQASTQKMTYTFDDKDPVSGTAQSGMQATAKLDLNQIDPQNTGQVRWGFTGATGDSYENNLVVIEEVPGLVDARATTRLTDTTTNQVIQDGDRLKGQDAFKLEYQLAYLSGKQDWQDVQAHLQIPDQLTVDAGKITYADGSTATVDLAGMTDNQVTVKLARALSATNATATISLTGTANNLKAPVTVDSAASTFSAVNGVVTADTPAFTLNPTLELYAASLSGSSVQLEANEDAVMKGLVVVPEGVDLTNADMTVHTTLNGKRRPDFQMTAGDDPSSGRFDVTVAAADLQSGQNTLITTVSDPYGNVSNEVKFTITVSRQLVFQTVADRSSFEETTLTGAHQRVKRMLDWQVEILDTREAGAKWTLQVTSTPFINQDGQPLAGTLSYHEGTDRTPIGTTPITISRGEAQDADVVTNVVDDWDDESGLLLEVNSSALASEYSSTVTWLLNDVP
ncbi:lectin-like domain-containing protein [Levilactobacillus suantsaiihabitans]|uniref:WxL domain-containing protein n=1 Tax=Levilactobacillus suantsaiihabitans TaxID=2487722 RepID=A0A4Z0J9V1_9LACO|nr:hypothetical protein [Levilactobacillus suantsaiihabitans]TGD18528.1 hypothetical protein EGT51_07700 [Levilactobacillus suantsaiihabitans]